MRSSIDEERDELLPRIARDRQDLDRAVDEVRIASAEAARRGAELILLGLGILAAVRYMLRWIHRSG